MDTSTSDTDTAARKWLMERLGIGELSLFPFTEVEERKIGATAARAAYGANAAFLAALFVFTAFHLTDRFEIGFAILIATLVNAGMIWENKHRLKCAFRLDHAFYETVRAGETDLALWPSFVPCTDHVKTAQWIASEAVKTRARSDARKSGEKA